MLSEQRGHLIFGQFTRYYAQDELLGPLIGQTQGEATIIEKIERDGKCNPFVAIAVLPFV